MHYPLSMKRTTREKNTRAVMLMLSALDAVDADWKVMMDDSAFGASCEGRLG